MFGFKRVNISTDEECSPRRIDTNISIKMNRTLALSSVKPPPPPNPLNLYSSPSLA